MSTGGGLAQALRSAADEVACYDVIEGAITRGRRRRRLGVATSALAVVAVLGLVATVVVAWLHRDEGVAQPPDEPTIPEHIGLPAPFTRDAAGSPPGPASLILSGHQGDVAVVGARADVYRAIDTDADPGWAALLSPSGDRVAYAGPDGVHVVDLVHGGARSYPKDSTVDDFAPSAWLPDGTGLVVLATTYADDPTTQGTRRQLSTLDLATGALDEFAEATWPIATPGFAVAVSPDGSRIAYQFSDFISVYNRATGEKTRFDLESYQFVLAGRAAWAPDGSLTLLHHVTSSNGRTWQLRLVDPATGAPRATIPAMRDQTVVRLIGWRDEDPVVVGYDGPYSALYLPGQVIISGFEGTVGVYLLSGGQPQVLVQPVEGISFIDVAEDLVADPRTRPGDPPWRLPWSDQWWPLLGLLPAVGLAIYIWAQARRQRSLTPRAGDPGRS
jgi:hypothetical protein